MTACDVSPVAMFFLDLDFDIFLISLEFGCSLCNLSAHIRYANNTLRGQSTTLDYPKRADEVHNRNKMRRTIENS